MFGANKLINRSINRLSDETNWNHDGNYDAKKRCIVMTVAALSGPDWRYKSRALNHIRKAISRLYPDRGVGRGDIITFNDHRETTHADVMAVMREAEKRSRPIWRRWLP